MKTMTMFILLILLTFICLLPITMNGTEGALIKAVLLNDFN